MVVHFVLNGQSVTADFDPNLTLLDVLREKFGLMGTKKGCGTGECGACTVLMGRKNICSCMMLIGKAEGMEITTIEGLAPNGELDEIQQAFVECGAVQCGYCTPGMILSVKALLYENENPTRAQVQMALSGNLCRCTGYEQIFEAVHMVLKRRRERDEAKS